MKLLTRLQRVVPFQRMLRLQAVKRAKSFNLLDPVAAQQKIFRDLLETAADTQFGRDNTFDRFKSRSFKIAYRYYKSCVPIRSYQEFMTDYFYRNTPASAIGRSAPDLDNTTWPGTIKMFCETSGTTAPTKFIPFSPRMFAENRQAALDMMSCYLAANPESEILNGKILYMSGSTRLTKVKRGVWSGDMSALTLRFRPWYLTPFVEPGADISVLPWEEKLQAMAELLLRDDQIRVISGVPPWIILLMKRCAEIGGKPLQELLPHLELIIHGGTSLIPYRNEFEKLFAGNVPNMLELLPSSEAFMAFQQQGDAQMRLTPYYGVFFEFVRFEDLDAQGKPAPYADAIPLGQVEIGQRYAVILTTCSGLWRYHLGDTIRFTSTDPHFIEFTGRDRFLDKLEEKITQGEVEQAVANVNRNGDWNVREFMVGTDVSARRHQWVLAVQDEDLNSDDAIRILDTTLRCLNADYATFRSQGRINAPDVLLVPETGIYQWSQAERGKLGGQTKIPHIDPTPDSSMIACLRDYHLCSGHQ
ncbi:MAG: GH3 auxin-responsive promoter family protein [Geobacteraceae bacterium]|nr:GH3 auxin-responsive promoter family protein [Geobacteraceae bacterium]NTW80488.1 GH3 auxin-responsive promoter family protein [Geobacteraceae bacterium]